MRCETIERELSARLDGAADHRLDARLADHLSSCERCRSFESRVHLIREHSRLEAVSELPPHLLPNIMKNVREAVPSRRSIRLPKLGFEWARYAAAFAAGSLIAVVAMSGIVPRGPRPALAREIPEQIAEASKQVTAYRATYEITEKNFHALAPTRRFTAQVAFAESERFRAEIKDLSVYPSERWPQNDIVLGVDRSRWSVSGPMTCPPEGMPACATGRRDNRMVQGREPFDSDTVLPTDIVLPVKTLAGSERAKVIGASKVLNRRAIVVQLTYRDSSPLFAYLQASGSWRPFFPLDDVILSLEENTWFPLAYEVKASASQERAAWASRNNLPQERSGTVLFSARVSEFDEEVTSGDLKLPAVEGVVRDSGFRDSKFESLEGQLGYELILPTDLGGLAPYRAGTYEGGSRPEHESLVSFTKGLIWLKIRQTPSWNEPSLYGNIGSLATSIDLEGGGVGYYEPATSVLGRRLSIHALDRDVYLESNLPREQLLKVASSLPIKGEKAKEQMSLEEAIAENPYLLLPKYLPEGYQLSSVQTIDVSGADGVTFSFRKRGSELDGVGIRVHQSDAVALPPPMEPDVSSIRVRGTIGRYSPTRNELEWVEDGIYRSISGRALDLSGLLRMAVSLSEPPSRRAP